ncbi:competence/damage-inducible protein CinA-like protein [Burkholderiales bacterium JOSHI_001]|nr:competence/damage-inducible protein CinA-like protein [Burkholderiales bacterium JOSHI_001]
MDDERQLVAALADALRAHGLRLATAESCTGGGVAAACTDLAGSSDWFERGFVTYSNAAKTDLLGVPAELIDAQGAVSEAVARAMAEGALRHALAEHAVAITGVAGPGGGSAAKPVGTVWFGFAQRLVDGRFQVQAEHRRFDGDRAAVRAAARCFALQGVLTRCKST